jgi:uncharacterized protein (TIGR03086 family)
VTAPVERGLLVRAIRYALATARLATPPRLPLPTPCARWDLRTLLHHVGDSMDALSEGLSSGFVQPGAAGDVGWADPGCAQPGCAQPGCAQPVGPVGGPVGGLSERAAALLCACAVAGSAESRVVIGDRELNASLITMTGAVEIAVHGWDIAVTCGGPGTVPPGLASELLPIAALLAPRGTRDGLFADPVPVADLACPGDRLVAFLGRRPRS